MKRKIFAIILVMSLLCAMAVPASAALNADVRNSVAVVATCLDTQAGDIRLSSGTGFFINEDHLVTNHHVVDSFLEFGAGELFTLNTDSGAVIGRAKIRAYFDEDEYEEAYIVGYDAQKDLAIIRLDEPTTERTPLKLKVPTEDMVGDAIYAVGYPSLSENYLADAANSWGKNDATVTAGTISRLLTTAGTGQQNVQIDCKIQHGNSGGPVVTSDGAVIGVATWGFSTSDITYDDDGNPIDVVIEDAKYAVNIAEAIRLLNQYSVSYTLATDAVPEEKPDFTWLIISVAAVLVIAGVVVLIIVLKKKGSKKAQPTAQAMVRSYANTNYGASAVVGSQPVLIGRGSNCALRFPGDAPGVSGSHCTVQWDAATRDFIVTDMNSTYGTFLISGQKMQPHQPYRLRAGDKFYLAEQSNTIGLSWE